jgi:polysaccharide pyruvyl transferase WcaK-like protein
MAILSHCAMVIGSRFHVLVLGLSASVPVVALGWSHKYEELLADFGLAAFVLEHQRGVRAEVRDVVRGAWNQREQSRAAIRGALGGVRERVDTLFDEVARSIAFASPAQSQ